MIFGVFTKTFCCHRLRMQSGTTGNAKGVMLSHDNVSNTIQILYWLSVRLVPIENFCNQ